MSDHSSRRISEAELTVLEALWDAAEAMPAKVIQETLKETRGWERTTVRSLLTRLTEKGAVTVDKAVDPALYAPAFTRAEYGWDLAEVLLYRLYGGDGAALAAALLDHGSLSPADLDALKSR